MRWKTFTISSDGTHHLENNLPAYNERFDEVLKFHEPGLAPVRQETKAWHIEPSGKPAYQMRFQRTFGFYEGRAAVVSSNGWHHILPSGKALYSERYLWCGNFQGRYCTVRGGDNLYWHIQSNGKAAYKERWSYAGDFKDGIAVVQANDGFSTHINEAGELIHNSWFLDLDIFHKSFARAKDEGGWTHINRNGKPLYARRFTMVEPFYNGQARVERSDGGLEVINEEGETVTNLRASLPSKSPRRQASNRVPEGIKRTLDVLDPSLPFALFIRHGERESFPADNQFADVDLTSAGYSDAGTLGTILAKPPGWSITSPFLRCRRTAEAIVNKSYLIETDTRLGAPGPWVIDEKAGAQLFNELGTEGTVRAQLAGKKWPFIRDLSAGTKLLISSVLERLNARQSSGVSVSHDAVLIPAISFLTQDSFEGKWLEPLDGFAVQLRGSSLLIWWQGRCQEIPPW